jgi:hypothetical protein
VSSKRDGATVVGVGAAACAACCAGPILGLLAAIGFTAAAATFVFGVTALIVAGLVVLIVVRRRRSRTRTCATGAEAVEISLAPPTLRILR